MCGLVGFIDTRRTLSSDTLAHVVNAMATTLTHRGPDDHGYWVREEAGLALGFRRLAIIDPTPDGKQPMTSRDDRFVVVFNGEIYNYRDLRSRLESEGARFKGHSDTEVLVEAFAHWGIEGTLEATNGMFALALWDQRNRRLYLARDRMGEKPLYYGAIDGTFFFGSELKSLEAHPSFHPSLDRQAVALFLRHNYIPTPWSIYREIRKLVPGTYVTVDGEGSCSEPQAYWSVTDAARAGRSSPLPATSESVDALRALLLEAVGLRMHADVPLGAFLSGGIDSSLIVALMQEQASERVKTFTVGFTEAAYNEADHAKKVAHHLGTDHTELYVTPAEAMAVIPRLPSMFDEPFADSSQIPTHLVSGLARQHVTVSLSGDGGDELFGGYDRYHIGDALWKRLAGMPLSPRRIVSRALLAVPPSTWSSLFAAGGRFSPAALRRSDAGARVHRAAALLPLGNQQSMYRALVSHWDPPDRVLLEADEPATLLTDPSMWSSDDFVSSAMLVDSQTYLPDDILTKVDRASMAASLEARVPLLDHRVVELAWRLPMEMKHVKGRGKIALRQILDDYVPSTLIERPKMGFGVPVGSWIKGPLREWAEDLLSEDRLRSQGLLRVDVVRDAWRQHVTGERDWQYHLWDVLMLQAWLDEHPHAGLADA